MPSNEQTRSDGDLPTQDKVYPQNAKNLEATTDPGWTPDSPSFFETKTGGKFGFAYNPHQFCSLDQLPLKFGSYTLLEKIGEGGAGIVFLANPDPDNLSANGRKTVALKMMRPEALIRGNAVKRFEKESRLHSAIECPFVTKHLEFGCERGVYFIASEFVEGCSLDKIIDKIQRAALPKNRFE